MLAVSVLQTCRLASFPGPTQLSVACGMERCEGSLVSYELIGKWQNFADRRDSFRVLFNRLHAQCLLCTTASPQWISRYMRYVTWYLCSSCCSPTHKKNLSTTIFSILTSLMWEKIPGHLSLFHTASDRKPGGAWRLYVGLYCSLQHAQSCSYLSHPKLDVLPTSIMPEVVLPSTFNNFQTHSSRVTWYVSVWN